jgi:hypothetical protein
MHRKILSTLQEKLLAQLTPHIVPANGPEVPHFQSKIVQRLDRFLFELPSLLRSLFLWGLRMFDLAAVFFAQPRRRFSRLSDKSRFDYIQRMSRSWFHPVRDWLFTCRGLILLFYYSQPEVIAALHYDPQTWARERVQARRQELHLTETIDEMKILSEATQDDQDDSEY